jgi:hypothetical protein
MHQILILPNIQPIEKPDTGYPVEAGYRLSGGGRIPDILPDFQLNIQMFNKIFLNAKTTDVLKVFFSLLKTWHFL